MIKPTYDFWLTCFATWATVKTVPIEAFQVSYDTPMGTIENTSWDRWTEPHATFRTLSTMVEVPFDDASLRFDLSGETLVRINQRPVYGVNPYHREFQVAYPAGTSLELTLEQVRTGLMGTHETAPGVRHVSWIQVDHRAESCYWDLKVLVEWGQHRDTPRHLSQWLWGALDRILQPLYAVSPDAMAVAAHTERPGRDAEEEGLFQALQHEFPSGLRPLSPALLDPALETIRVQFEDLYTHLRQSRLPGIGTLKLFGHAHIDLAWLWPVAETRRKVLRTVAGQSYLLSQFPDWRFGMSSPAMWDMVRPHTELWNEWKQLVDDHRIEPLGAFWVESDAQLIDGGSVLRHLFYGLRYFQKVTGRRLRTAFLPDTFGFSGSLPTLLAHAGIRLFLTTKINWNDTTTFPYKDFRWVGPDGSSVQAQIFGTSPDGYNGKAHLADLRAAWQGYVDGGGAHEVLYAFGHGDGGGGPDRDMLERIQRYRGLPAVPNIDFGAPEDLILPDSELSTLPAYSGDLYLEYHRGVFTAQTRVKSLNRKMQAILSATEAWTTMANLDLDREGLWRQLLANHFHDILPGSSIGAVYQDVHRDFSDLATTTHEATQRALSSLFAQGPEPFMILGNPSPFHTSSQLIEVDAPIPNGFEVYWDQVWHQAIKASRQGHWTIPIPALPPLAAVGLPIRPVALVPVAPNTHDDHPSTYTWQGDQLAVTIAPEGIQTLALKGRQILKHPATIRTFFQHPERFDAWELVDESQRGYVELVDEPVAIEEDTAHRIVIRLTHRVSHSTIVEHIEIDKVYERISLTMTMDLEDRHLVVQYLVPTTLVSDRVTRESLWGPQYVPTVPKGPQDRAAFEWVAHRFVDMGEPHQGFALLNDGRYGHSVNQGTLCITLATTPLYPDPEADRTPEPVRLRLLPHPGHWTDAGVMAEASSFSHPPVTIWSSGGSRTPQICSPLPTLPSNVALLAFKPAEDGSGDRICYLGEMWGDEARFDLHWTDSTPTICAIDFISERALEEASRAAINNGSSLYIPPRGFLALRIHGLSPQRDREVTS